MPIQTALLLKKQLSGSDFQNNDMYVDWFIIYIFIHHNSRKTTRQI